MELEINKIIREKVLAAEGQPVAWQKERVWRMIRPESASKSRTVYYYAAASLLIAISVIYTVHVQNQKQLADKIDALESVIHDKIKPDGTPSGTLKTSGAEIGVEKNAQPVTIRREFRSKRHTPVAIEVPEIIPEVAVEPSEIAAVTIDDAPTEPGELIPETPQVQAIIGFIPKPVEATVIVKNKKSKFRLFRNRNDELNTFINEENKFLTARIN